MSRRLSSWPVERSLNGRSVVVASLVVVLRGVLVVDFTRYLPGPFASRELLRLGARVVRVETPDGDPLRSVAPGWDDALNTGKESVVWDLERDPGLGPALAARADVVLEGFRPGVAARLGIDYETLRARNPRLVYCAITGYGQDGPYRDRVGHDVNYLGYAGVLNYIRDTDGRPVIPGVQIADIGGGALMAAVGILTALLAREQTGRGQLVDVAMLDGGGLFRHVGDLFGFLCLAALVALQYVRRK